MSSVRLAFSNLCYIHTKFYENLPSGSDVISGGHTDRQTAYLISLLSFLESRLKRDASNITAGQGSSEL
jgi:hypothetical protein